MGGLGGSGSVLIGETERSVQRDGCWSRRVVHPCNQREKERDTEGKFVLANKNGRRRRQQRGLPWRRNRRSRRCKEN